MAKRKRAPGTQSKSADSAKSEKFVGAVRLLVDAGRPLIAYPLNPKSKVSRQLALEFHQLLGTQQVDQPTLRVAIEAAGGVVLVVEADDRNGFSHDDMSGILREFSGDPSGLSDRGSLMSSACLLQWSIVCDPDRLTTGDEEQERAIALRRKVVIAREVGKREFGLGEEGQAKDQPSTDGTLSDLRTPSAASGQGAVERVKDALANLKSTIDRLVSQSRADSLVAEKAATVLEKSLDELQILELPRRDNFSASPAGVRQEGEPEKVRYELVERSDTPPASSLQARYIIEDGAELPNLPADARAIMEQIQRAKNKIGIRQNENINDMQNVLTEIEGVNLGSIVSNGDLARVVHQWAKDSGLGLFYGARRVNIRCTTGIETGYFQARSADSDQETLFNEEYFPPLVVAPLTAKPAAAKKS